MGGRLVGRGDLGLVDQPGCLGAVVFQNLQQPQHLQRRSSPGLALLGPSRPHPDRAHRGPDFGAGPNGEPNQAQLAACHAHLKTLYPDTGDALRVLRQWWVERLAHLDCDAQAPLSLITQGMTWLAEYTLDVALKEATATVAARHGRPRRSDGQEACLWVIGMGKLGAVELNVSSDIDLVYVYDEDGRTQGDSGDTVSIDNHVFFDKVVKQLFQLIGATTEHGQVFRMDLALRPNGESGPSVVSLAALETYFQVQVLVLLLLLVLIL